MPDRDETLLPLPVWTGVLEQLSLPLRAYRHQLMRAYEPFLHLGEQILQTYGGWMRQWERLVYWERLITVTRSAFDAPDWEAEQGTSTVSAVRRTAQPGPAVALRDAALAPALDEAHETARPGPGGAGWIGSRAEGERVLADLASALEAALNDVERVTSSLVRMIDEQRKLLASISRPLQEGARGHEKQAPQ